MTPVNDLTKMTFRTGKPTNITEELQDDFMFDFMVYTIDAPLESPAGYCFERNNTLVSASIYRK